MVAASCDNDHKLLIFIWILGPGLRAIGVERDALERGRIEGDRTLGFDGIERDDDRHVQFDFEGFGRLFLQEGRFLIGCGERRDLGPGVLGRQRLRRVRLLRGVRADGAELRVRIVVPERHGEREGRLQFLFQ